jgi:nucleoside-diphosphate-sugar epimerase
MKIFMTGVTGFIGSNLARRLVMDGHQVNALVRPTSDVECMGEARHKVELTLYDGELLTLVQALENFKADMVIHVASLFLARHQSSDVEKLVEGNIAMPSKLLEAMVLTGVTRFINTGTSWQHFEDADFSPVNLYASTKQAFEDILKFYTEASGLKAITLKLFDTYGPNDPRPKLFTLLARNAGSGDVLKMSPGEQLLDLVYVDDVIDAYVATIKKFDSLANETFAVSGTERYTLREVAHVYAEAVGKNLNIVWGGLPYRPRETLVPWTHGRKIPGWQPHVGLTEGIRRMVAFGTP